MTLCVCCVCTRASNGPIIKNTEHWNPSSFFPLTQHLNANTLTNTMHYLKATVLDPTRSFFNCLNVKEKRSCCFTDDWCINFLLIYSVTEVRGKELLSVGVGASGDRQETSKSPQWSNPWS